MTTTTMNIPIPKVKHLQLKQQRKSKRLPRHFLLIITTTKSVLQPKKTQYK